VKTHVRALSIEYLNIPQVEVYGFMKHRREVLVESALHGSASQWRTQASEAWLHESRNS
jgi:hypothetical protein